MYSLHDLHDGALVGYERFSCAPGPVGWRYASSVLAPDGRTVGLVDLTVDLRWRQRRVEVRSAEWAVRGGVNGPETVWVRTPARAAPSERSAERAAEPSERAERAARAARAERSARSERAERSA